MAKVCFFFSDNKMHKSLAYTCLLQSKIIFCVFLFRFRHQGWGKVICLENQAPQAVPEWHVMAWETWQFLQVIGKFPVSVLLVGFPHGKKLFFLLQCFVKIVVFCKKRKENRFKYFLAERRVTLFVEAPPHLLKETNFHCAHSGRNF